MKPKWPKKNLGKQGRISTKFGGGGGKFFWLARIYTPVSITRKKLHRVVTSFFFFFWVLRIEIDSLWNGGFSRIFLDLGGRGAEGPFFHTYIENQQQFIVIFWCHPSLVKPFSLSSSRQSNQLETISLGIFPLPRWWRKKKFSLSIIMALHWN